MTTEIHKQKLSPGSWWQSRTSREVVRVEEVFYDRARWRVLFSGLGASPHGGPLLEVDRVKVEKFAAPCALARAQFLKAYKPISSEEAERARTFVAYRLQGWRIDLEPTVGGFIGAAHIFNKYRPVRALSELALLAGLKNTTSG